LTPRQSVLACPGAIARTRLLAFWKTFAWKAMEIENNENARNEAIQKMRSEMTLQKITFTICAVLESEL